MIELINKVKNLLLNGDKKNAKTENGTTVNMTTKILDGKEILCLVPQFSHRTGLYNQFAFQILPHLNEV